MDIGGGIAEYMAGLLNDWSLGGEADTTEVCPVCSEDAEGPRRWFRSFSSRRHLALLFENHTWILASGSPILAASRSRANTSG